MSRLRSIFDSDARRVRLQTSASPPSSIGVHRDTEESTCLCCLEPCVRIRVRPRAHRLHASGLKPALFVYEQHAQAQLARVRVWVCTSLTGVRVACLRS
jgi:hypothetical protein